jgi:hypothetical protein
MHRSHRVSTRSKSYRIDSIEAGSFKLLQCLVQRRFWCRNSGCYACGCSINTTGAVRHLSTAAKIGRHRGSDGDEIGHCFTVKYKSCKHGMAFLLTANALTHPCFPECKTIVESTSRVLGARSLKPNTCVYAAGPCAHIGSDEVMKQDAHPLRSGCAPAVCTYGASLRDIVGTRGDCGGEIGRVGAPIGDEDVFEEGSGWVGVVKSCGRGRAEKGH